MKRIIMALIVSLSLVFTTIPVLAYDLFGQVDCSQAPNSAVCTDKGNTGNPIAGPNGLLIKIADIIIYIAGAAAVILLIISGIRFITSSGDPEKTKSARSTLIGVVIGLVVIVLARVLIVFVLNKL